MRSSATVLLLISCFFAKFARSQSNELLIHGETGKLYLEYTVVPKDNWYSVGRLYNVNPKVLALYNHTTLGKPLIVGEKLEIPLTATNFSQTGLKAAGETLVPVIHITQEREWMYRISVNHNRVPIATLEKWNNVNKDAVRPGMHLI
ncbi:MAG TPA: LysM peptidoglycan-binding domain-containing protein, partial [Puia sp.]|nr:LysM peptidoglycan-binding domain-containing protein [Puia sp.]